MSHSVTPWTTQFMEFSRPEYWSGLGFGGIFPTQGSNQGLLHCMWILYQPSHKGSPRTLAWVSYPFSRGSSRPRDRTQVVVPSHISLSLVGCRQGFAANERGRRGRVRRGGAGLRGTGSRQSEASAPGLRGQVSVPGALTGRKLPLFCSFSFPLTTADGPQQSYLIFYDSMQM